MGTSRSRYRIVHRDSLYGIGEGYYVVQKRFLNYFWRDLNGDVGRSNVSGSIERAKEWLLSYENGEFKKPKHEPIYID